MAGDAARAVNGAAGQHAGRLAVHLLMEPQAEVLEHLRQRLLPGIEITVGRDLLPSPSCEILVGGRAEAKHLVAGSRLRSLIVPWAGLSPRLRELLRRHRHISVHNLHHNAGAVAELAVALLLAAAKLIVPLDRKLRRGDWTPRYEPNRSILLGGRHAVILGHGAIGRRVGAICEGLGMRVTGVRRRPPTASPGSGGEQGSEAGRRPEDRSGVVRGVESLHALLPEADALILCLPLTEKTEGIIGAAEIALLPSTALLVNVGRGPLVDERALYEALAENRLGGAGIDVWYRYPESEDLRSSTLPSNFPFHELDNVVLSPHRAGALGNLRSEHLRMEALACSLNAAARGEEIPFRVDLDEGY